MKRFFLFFLLPLIGKSQFAPAAGMPGTSAIKKDSSIILNWATGCKIVRGLQDISNIGTGYATYGDSSKAIGVADGVNVVSLGDGGNAILTFQMPIKNGSGPDFCVFENSFDAGFLELAFVEVSSDGINFTRFPATCNIQSTLQIGPFDTSSDPTKINNLAGKYIANYGVPFDLQELQGTIGLNVDNITHVKIIDVVGCIQAQYARYDKDNKIINDLWSTPFPSSGFDLDAVGVINQVPVSVTENKMQEQFISVFPTQVNDNLTVMNGSENLTITIINPEGKEVMKREIKTGKNNFSISDLAAGIYLVRLNNLTGICTKKIVKCD